MVALSEGHPTFSSFSSVSGSEERNPLFLVVRMEIVIFAVFRQNHLFSVGDHAAQHINFISPQNAENGDPKSEIGMGREIPGNSGFL